MDETTGTTSTSGVARWSRLAALGLLMVAAASLIWLIAGAIWGLDLAESAVFLAPTLVVPSIAAFLVLRFGVWAKVVGIVVALAGAAFLWFTIFGLFDPSSFFDFVGGLLVVPGVLIALVGCVRAIGAQRRGDLVPRREGGEARAINVIVAVVAVLAVVSGVITIASRSTADASQADAEVALHDFSFDPEDGLSVTGGSTVYVENKDPFHHTFTIDDLDIDVSFGPSSQELVEIPAQPGTYILYCRPHTANPDDPGESDMATTLTVG